MRNFQQGFTLIELMIVVAIIGILAAVAIPNYQQYTMKAKFTEVVQATAPVKTAVELCAQDLGTVTGCNGGDHGIPADLGAFGTYGKSVTTADGVITATAVKAKPFNEETFILKPAYSSTTGITWDNTTGTCRTGTTVIC